MSHKTKNRYYILVGNKEAWEASFLHNVWGFSDRTKGLWNTSHTGDYVAFYITAPIGKVVGFGKFGEKFVDERLIWPDELLFQKLIWRYRIRIHSLTLVPDWTNGIPLSGIMLNTGRKVIDERTFSQIIKLVNQKMKVHSRT